MGDRPSGEDRRLGVSRGSRDCRRRERLDPRLLRQTRKAVLLEQLPRGRQSGAHGGARVSDGLRRNCRGRSGVLHHSFAGGVRIHDVAVAERWRESARLHSAEQVSRDPPRGAGCVRLAGRRARRVHRRSHPLPFSTGNNSASGEVGFCLVPHGASGADRQADLRGAEIRGRHASVSRLRSGQRSWAGA